MLKLRTLTFIFCMNLSTGSIWSQTHEHKHEHVGTKQLDLALDNGKKWQTDAPLREGMASLRSLAQVAQKANTSDANQTAAGRMNEEVQKIFRNCKLTPKADAMLHLILTDLMSNIERLKDPKSNSAESYANILKTLDAYGQYFDDQGKDTSKKP